jgi:uncharacterized NAD(P)/FAD-binding protein YdhS
VRLFGEGDDPSPLRVVVVGGGAAAVVAAVQLLREAEARPVAVRIIEKDEGIGPGLAYRTGHPRHTLNNFAGRLSAVVGDPDHLLRWCERRGLPADPQSFLPRRLYGTYLAETLTDVNVPRGSSLSQSRAEVTDVVSDDGVQRVRTAGGWEVEADVVVLALGNPPPHPRPELEELGQRYLADPWTRDTMALAAKAARARSVLLVGTGLTMVDVVAQLHDSHPGLTFTAVSRSLLLPRAHRRRTLHPHDEFHPGATSLDELMATVLRRIAEVEEIGGDWRDVVDAVRAYANEIWHGFSTDEQDRFVAELARLWDVARHRMSPEMAAHVETLIASGVLELAPAGTVDPTTYDLVVNCSGPAPVHTPGWSRLVDRLLARGVLVPHRLGLGLDLDEQGRPRDANGRVHRDLYVLGAARKGLEWEVAAIPDLRAQAEALSRHLAERHGDVEISA